MKKTDDSNEVLETTISAHDMDLSIPETGFRPVNKITIPKNFFNRIKTGIEKLDKLFNLGFVPGMTFTITAQAGCGKTTLWLQTLESMAMEGGYNVAYISGEESIEQLAYNCKRINVSSVLVANMTNVENIAKAIIENAFDFVIIDAFQTLHSPHAKGARQTEKHCISTLIKAAKEANCVIGFIVHLTKMGVMKGTTLLPHAVDCNMRMDKGDPEVYGSEHARELSIEKNRFGPIGDTVLHMGSAGFDFEHEVNKVVEVPSITTAGKNKKARDKEAGLKMFEDAIKGAPDQKLSLRDGMALSGFDTLKVKRFMKELEGVGKVTMEGRGLEVVWTYVPEEEDED